MKKIGTFIVVLILFASQIFASAYYTTATAAKINIQITNGVDNYNDMTNLSNFSGTKSNSSYFHLKSAEAWVAKDNGSDITGGNFNYRVYKQGASAPSFTTISFSWQEGNGTTIIYQRWGNYSVDIDLLSGVNSSGTWVFECYYHAPTNGVNCTNPIYLNNGGSNYSFTFTADATLPVEISTFSASVINKSVNLVWHTATEVNNYGFEIEKRQLSVLNSQWSKVGFVNGNGNSSSTNDYSYTDKTVTSGKYSYRLKQIDNDGQYEYSKEVEVDLGKPTTFALNQNYPNPFNPSTSIQYSVVGSQYVSLKVFNVLGKEVAVLVNEKREPGTYTVDFTSANLSGGAYFYRLQAGDFVQTKKMILLK